MNLKNNFLIIIFLSFFCLTFVNANGLSITSDNTFIMNKTYNVDEHIIITIHNDEPWTFYNITLEDNNFASMSKIDILASGESKNVSILITADENINDILTLKGYYLASLGDTNVTHFVDLSYNNGPSKCDFSITKGDQIVWTNIETTATKYFKLVNSDTLNVIHQIEANTSWTQVFDTPAVLPFHLVDRTGWADHYCELTVLDDSGYVNNPELDAKIGLNISVVYPNTAIELFTLTNDYNMKFYEEKEDILSVKNTGTRIAKSVHLKSDWFTFTVNDFDLNPGESRNVGYTIDPKIYNSNETDKTYTKKLSVTGNFPEVTHDFSVYIEYAEIVTADENNATTLKDYICENFPEFCEPQVVYKYVDSGEAEINVTYTQNQVKQLYDLIFDYLDEQDNKDKKEIEQDEDTKDLLANITNATSGATSDISDINQRMENSNNTILFVAWIFGMIITGLLIFFLALKYRDKYLNNIWSRYG